MPAYLVELPENRRVQGVNVLSVFAANAAGARRAASGQFDGDANDLWNTVASVTEVVVGAELADAGDGWTMYAHISGGAAQTVGFDPYVVNVDGLDRDLYGKGGNRTPRKHISLSGIVINDGGASNVDDDIYTLVGGTFTRAATFRAIGTGAITSFDVVDPGEYTVLPTLTAAAFTTSGSGTGDDIDLVQAADNSYEALMAQMVTGLLGNPDISDAMVDFSETGVGTRLLTLASIADGIGDATVVFEVRQNGTPETVLVSTITDGGIAAAVLTMAIPADPLVPARVKRLAAL